MVRARNQLVIDRDVALRPELVDQLLDGARSDDFVGLALDDDAGGGAGRQKAEVVHVRGRRDRNEALDFGPAHQQLHADPGAEANARNPGRLGFRMDALYPVEGACSIRQLADAIVEHALALADSAEIESQRRESAL